VVSGTWMPGYRVQSDAVEHVIRSWNKLDIGGKVFEGKCEVPSNHVLDTFVDNKQRRRDFMCTMRARKKFLVYTCAQISIASIYLSSLKSLLAESLVCWLRLLNCRSSFRPLCQDATATHTRSHADISARGFSLRSESMMNCRFAGSVCGKHGQLLLELSWEPRTKSSAVVSKFSYTGNGVGGGSLGR
jgi:hypothetical protein